MDTTIRVEIIDAHGEVCYVCALTTLSLRFDLFITMGNRFLHRVTQC
jgi:hypothetical protein